MPFTITLIAQDSQPALSFQQYIKRLQILFNPFYNSELKYLNPSLLHIDWIKLEKQLFTVNNMYLSITLNNIIPFANSLNPNKKDPTRPL